MLALICCLSLFVDDERVSNNFSPTIGDYEEYFNKYKTFAEKAFDPEAWSVLKFVHKKTNEEKSFKDMTPLEKYSVMLSIGDKITKEMTVLSAHWEKEEKVFSDKEYKPKERKDAKGKLKAAQKEDVQKFRKDLLELRKRFALDYEKFAVSSMEKFKKEIEEKERDFIIKQIRDMHDELSLVERMKKAEE